jgi:hypothetical protein
VSEPEAGCALCAPAGIAIADASARTASWLGNKFRAALDLIEWCLFFDESNLRLTLQEERVMPLAYVVSNARAKPRT